MDLQELKFRVDTKELDNAVTKVGELGEAVSKVNTPLSELAKNSKGAAKGAAEFSASAEKAGKGAKGLADNTDAVDAKLQKLRDQLGFLRNDLNMSETGFSKMQAGVMASMKAIGASDAQLKQFATTFDQFNKIMGEQALDKSVAGFNMLNRQMREFQMTNELAAKGFNLTSTQVKQLARDIEALQQQNQEFGRSATFGVDELTKKYVSAANSVNQYIAAAKESEQAAKREAQAAVEAARAKDLHNAAIARQYELVRQSAWKEYAAGVGQTSDEIKALSSYYNNLQKETEQANSAIEKQFGMLRSSAWKEYSNSVGQTSDEMKKLNNYFREQEKAASDLEAQRFKALGVEQQVATTKKQIIDEATRSEQYLIKETEKLIFVNEKLAQGFSTASANALFKYQEALQKTGRTADQVQKELADLGVELMKKQGTSPISSMRKDIQQLDQSVNHLARNIGVQFTDIFVALANGQSIFQVATQQGGQLSDAFLLAGISGGKMTDQLVEGAKAIYSSYKVLLSAFLDLAGRGIMSAGNAIVDFGSKVTGTNLILNTSRSIIESVGGDSEKFISIIDKMGASFRFVAGAGVGLLAAGFVAMGVAMVQVLKEQQALNLAINTTGASLGLTKDSAIELTRSLSDIGVNITNATAVLTELAKGGTLSAESFEYVAEAADKMQKYAGVSIDKTVADFNKLAKEPAKNLAELAGKTGYVTEETLRYIQSLEDEGKQIEAVQAATEAMAEAKIKAAESAYASASPLIQLWIDIKSAVSDAWSEFKDATSQGEGLASIIRVAWETVAVIVSEVWYVLKMTGKVIGGIAAMISRVLVGDFAGAKTIWNSMGEDAKKAREQQDATVKSIIEGVKVVQDAGAKERQENARNAASFEEKEKARKKALEESKRAAEKAAKDYTKSIENALKQYSDLVDLSSGFNKDFSEKEAALNLLLSKKLLTQGQYNEAYAALLKLQPVVKKQMQDEVDLANEKLKREQDYVNLRNQLAKEFGTQDVALKKQSGELDFQYSILGKTDQQVKELTREYNKQQKINELDTRTLSRKSEIYEKFLKLANENGGDFDFTGYNEAMRRVNEQNAEERRLIESGVNLEVAKDYADRFKEIQSTVADIISTALFEGGKAGQKKLKDVLKAAFSNFVLNVLINPITQGVGGSIGNTLLGTSNSGISSIGTLIGEGFNSYISNTAFGALLSSSAGYAAAIGGGSIAAGSQAAMLAAQTGGFGAAGTALTAQAAGGISGSLGGIYSSLMSNPWTLALGAGLLLFGDDIIGGLFGDAGTAHTGGVGSYSATGGTSYGIRSNVVNGYTGGVAFGADAYSEQTAKGSAELAKGMVTLLDSFAQTFGKEVGYYVGTGFADDTSGDGAWGGLLVKLGDKIIKDWGRGVDKWPGREFANGQAGQEQYMEAIAKDTRDIMSSIAPDWAKSILESLGDDVTFDSLNQALTLIGQINTAFRQLSDVFPVFNSLSGEAQTQLLQFFGGVEGLTGSLAGYYENFYSEQEKITRQTDVLTEAFESLGYELPTSRAEFRSIVESLDLTTESGRATFTAMMSLQEPFAALDQALGGVASTVENTAESITAAYERLSSVSRTAEDIANERIDLEKELFYLVSDSATIREYERNQIDATNRAIWDAIQAFKVMMPIIGEINALKAKIAEQENPEVSSIESQKKAIEDEIANIDTRLEVLKTERDKLNEQLDVAEKLLDASKSLKEFVDSLKTSALSALSDFEKLGIFKADYQKNLSLAKGGDTEAMGKLQSTVGDYLDVLQKTSGSATDYARQFLTITNDLDALATSGIDSSQKTIDAVKDKLDAITAEEADLTSQKEALGTQLNDLNSQNSLQVLKDQLAIQEQLLFDTASQSLEEIISTDNIATVLGALPAGLASQLSALLLPVLTANFKQTATGIYSNTGLNANTGLSSSIADQVSSGSITVSQGKDLLVRDYISNVLTNSAVEYRAKTQGYMNILGLGYTHSDFVSTVESMYGTNPSITTELEKLKVASGITKIYQDVLGVSRPDEAGLQWWVEAFYNGSYNRGNIVDAMVNAALANGQTGINTSLADSYVPQFAEGGYYSGGLALVGEEGPELINFSNPGQVYNASQTASMLDSSELVFAVQQLQAEVAAMRSDNNTANRQIALNTGISKTTLRKWDDEGMPDVRV